MSASSFRPPSVLICSQTMELQKREKKGMKVIEKGKIYGYHNKLRNHLVLLSGRKKEIYIYFRTLKPLYGLC
jgi:hypothetical protein